MAQGYPSVEARPTVGSLYRDDQMEIIDGRPDDSEVVGMVESTNRMLEYEKLRIIAVRAQQIRRVLLISAMPSQASESSDPFLSAAWAPHSLSKSRKGYPSGAL